MYIPTFYQGNVPIEIWEIPVYLFIFISMVIYGIILVKRRSTFNKEYNYFLPGLITRLVSGLAFGIIYIFFYKGGDTIAYFESALATSNLTNLKFNEGMRLIFSEHEFKDFFEYSNETGYPLEFIFLDYKTFMVIRILTPILFISMNSYFICTLWISFFAFLANWKFYKMMVEYYPGALKNLAIGILFLPSVLFWGSGILKDSITLSGCLLMVVFCYQLFIKKRYSISSVLGLCVASLVTLIIKPYIFYVTIPGILIWIFYDKIVKINLQLLRFILIPLLITGIISIFSYLSTTEKGFSFLEEEIKKASIKQKDLKRDEYKGNSFDIGDYDPTLSGALKKFPAAVTAGLFRPYIWESRNLQMVISGLENLIILIAFIYMIIKVGIKNFFKMIFSDPFLIFAFVYSILFAFVIGISTSNFGALVRFKIPILPFLVSSIIILLNKVNHQVGQRRV